MKNQKIIFTVFFILIAMGLYAQNAKATWKNIVQTKDENWFASEDAIRIAENVLLYQRDIGGWTKNIQMQNPLTEGEVQKLLLLKSNPDGCTIDNSATCQELLFLSKIYKKNPNEKYKNAFLKGVMYLISAQYNNGGWPQYFPLKKGYYSHITFNDDAIVNVLSLLREIKDNTDYYAIKAPTEIQTMASNAYEKGIECILKTQYKQKGKLTAWCAQHDRETFQPAKARAYELPSLSGKESAKITLLLMAIENPSEPVVKAIEAAVCWFEKTKITGITIEDTTTADGKKDRVVVENKDADPLWARFMELDSNVPFFCDRDGVKKATIAGIGIERRNGYAWYTNEPKEVIKKYKNWKEKVK